MVDRTDQKCTTSAVWIWWLYTFVD